MTSIRGVNGFRSSWRVRAFFGEQGIEEQEAGADDDGTVGHIEVGPVVAEDVDLNEVDDGAVDDAIVEVAERSAEHQGEGGGGEGDSAAEADQGDEDGDCGDGGKGNESPADGVGRGGVGEEREGRALIEPVRDAQEAGDDGDGFAEGRCARPRVDLGERSATMTTAEMSRSQGSLRGAGKLTGRPRTVTVAVDSETVEQWTVDSVCVVRRRLIGWPPAVGSGMPISWSALWQRVQTFCQMP